MKKFLLLLLLVVLVNGCDDGETTYTDYKNLNLYLVSLDYIGSSNSFCENVYNKVYRGENTLDTPIEFSPLPGKATDSIESRIIYCINKNNKEKVINNKCGKSVNVLLFESESTQKKCLKKINKQELKKKKRWDKIVEKCIKKSGKMKTDSAAKNMLNNCIAQNTYK